MGQRYPTRHRNRGEEILTDLKTWSEIQRDRYTHTQIQRPIAKEKDKMENGYQNTGYVEGQDRGTGIQSDKRTNPGRQEQKLSERWRHRDTDKDKDRLKMPPSKAPFDICHHTRTL